LANTLVSGTASLSPGVCRNPVPVITEFDEVLRPGDVMPYSGVVKPQLVSLMHKHILNEMVN